MGSCTKHLVLLCRSCCLSDSATEPLQKVHIRFFCSQQSGNKSNTFAWKGQELCSDLQSTSDQDFSTPKQPAKEIVQEY